MKITTLTWKSKIKVNPKHRDCFCSIFPYPSTQYRLNRSHVHHPHHPHICSASHRTEVNQIKFLPSDLPPLTRRQALHHSRPNYVAISKSNNGHSLSATTVPPISSLDSESELCTGGLCFVGPRYVSEHKMRWIHHAVLGPLRSWTKVKLSRQWQ